MKVSSMLCGGSCTRSTCFIREDNAPFSTLSLEQTEAMIDPGFAAGIRWCARIQSQANFLGVRSPLCESKSGNKCSLMNLTTACSSCSFRVDPPAPPRQLARGYGPSCLRFYVRIGAGCENASCGGGLHACCFALHSNTVRGRRTV